VVAQELEDMDKTIEIMKAAMEKEKQMRQEQKNMEKEEKDMQEADNKANTNTAEADSENIKTDGNEEAKMETTKEADISKSSEKRVAAKTETDEISEELAAEDEGKQTEDKDAKSKELEARDAKIAELTDRLMRTMAEFDNYRKRTEKEKSMMFDLGVKSILEKILPVVDNFERGLSSVSEEDKNSSFVQGIELIYKQFMTILDEIGLKPIDAVGKEFDPNLHNAVMHGEDENLGPNIVSEEFQKGYTYHDMVVRHSMVKVVN